ncbi:MAG: DALR domain-containing protein [Microthrixaceae bacterium]
MTEATISAAEHALVRLDTLGRRLDRLGLGDVQLGATGPDQDVLDSFRSAMDDDMDTPAVSAQIFGLVTRINRLLDDGDEAAAAPLAAALLEMLRAVGLTLSTADDEVPVEISELAQAREVARLEKNWALADELRDRIADAGYSVEDSAEGPILRRN